jgi:hypothetical protein
VVDVACRPEGFLISPYGEIGSLGQTAEENRRNIAAIGPGTAVLLSSGDHDTTAPPAAQRGDYRFYRENCGCDVSFFSIPESGHLFMAHRALPAWIDHVVGWLGSRGLPPASGAPGVRVLPRARARGLTLRVSPRRDRRAPFRFRIRGRLRPPAGMSAADACAGGRVTIQVKAGRSTVSARRAKLRRNCTYRRAVTFRKRSRLGRAGKLRFRARFHGNDTLRPRASRTRGVAAGSRFR